MHANQIIATNQQFIVAQNLYTQFENDDSNKMLIMKSILRLIFYSQGILFSKYIECKLNRIHIYMVDIQFCGWHGSHDARWLHRYSANTNAMTATATGTFSVA